MVVFLVVSGITGVAATMVVFLAVSGITSEIASTTGVDPLEASAVTFRGTSTK